MIFKYLEDMDVEYVYKEIFDNNGNLKLMPASYYNSLPEDTLPYIGHEKAIYSFPTIQLYKWVKEYYDLSNAIEIGSGAGGLHRLLGIKGTDSKMQELPEVIEQYKLMRQPTIKYPDDVEKIDAISAIKKYKPDIVIGCWITQLYNPITNHGSIYGVNEIKLLKKVKTYITIGNQIIHGQKDILKFKHEKIIIDGLVSRSTNPKLNCIYVWEN